MLCVLLVLAAFLATPAAAGEVLAPSQCASSKLKAVGAYAKSRARCRAKAAAKGVAVDASCETGALAKLQKAFAKADAKGDCLVTGNVDTFEAETETYFAHLDDALTTLPACCDLGPGGGAGSDCTWTLGAPACTALGGTLGAPGTACHGTGVCLAPPLDPGPCCETDGACVGGTIGSSTCTSQGGTYFDSAICVASGDCVAP